jgi:hypothetical protein
VRLGEFLRNERIRKGISLETAAEDTRIRDVYLRALEEENYDLIPGELYQRHYFKTYLEYLGHEDLYYRLTRERPKPAQVSDRMVRKPTEDFWDTARYIRVVWRLVLLVVAVGIIIWLVAWGLGSIRGGTEPSKKQMEELEIDILPYVPNLGDELDQAIVDAIGPTADLGDTGSQIAGGGEEHTLRIDVDGECWLRVSGPDGVIFSGLMQGGDTKEFGPATFFVVRLGKPENAWVYFDNEHIYGGEAGRPSSLTFSLPADYGFTQEDLDRLLDLLDEGASEGGT